MSGIKQICQKELARVFRDKKMILSVFLLPVIIMGGIMSLASNLSSKAQEDVEAHNSIVYVQNEPAGFGQFLQKVDTASKVYEVKDRSATEQMLRDGEADLLIEFPETFMDDISNYKAGSTLPQIKTYYNPSEDYSRVAFEKISTGVFETYRQTFLEKRISDLEALTVFTVNADNPNMVIQDEGKAGGKILGTILPYLVTILLFAGAMGIGTDMVAGEKERGTMASLLVSPIKRSSIVLGKVFALMVISGVSAVAYVGAMVAFMPQILGGVDMGVNLTLSIQQTTMLGALLIVLSFIYSAIIVLISVFAKTVKEASSYIMPAYMLVLVTGMTTIFTTTDPKGWYYAIPIYNTSLTLQGILTQDISMMEYGMTLGTTLVLGVILIVGIAKVFESEKVMAA